MRRLIFGAAALLLTVAASPNPPAPVFNLNSSTVTPSGGNTSRTLANLFGQVINVKDYGATCDGSTNDRIAINNALTAAGNGNVKTVYFPPSSTACMIAAPLTPPSGISIVAYPGTATIKASSTNGSTPLLFSMETGSPHDILIYGLTIDGNVSGQTGVGGAANKSRVNGVVGGSRIVFDHVKFQNTYGQALQFSTNVTYSGVRDSTFDQVGMYWHTSGLKTDATQAVTFTDVSEGGSIGNFAENNIFTNIGFDAINTAYQTHFSAIGNECILNNQQWYSAGVGNACVFTFGSRGFLVANNISYGASGNAFDLSGSESMIVVGNESYNAGVAGFLIGTGITYGVTTGMNRFVMTGNTSINAGQNINTASAGLLFAKGGSGGGSITQGVVAGNVFSDNQGVPTQKWGIARTDTGFGLAALTGVSVDVASNQISGDIAAPITGLSPTVSGCGSGSPALDANATDFSGTITEGTTATGCVLTFSSAKNTTPHCTLTSPNSTAFSSYSVSTTALTIVNSSASGNQYTYVCAP